MGKRLSGSTGASVNFCSTHYMNVDPLNDSSIHTYQNLGKSLWSISKNRSNKVIKNSNKIHNKSSHTRSKRCNSPLNP